MLATCHREQDENIVIFRVGESMWDPGEGPEIPDICQIVTSCRHNRTDPFVPGLYPETQNLVVGPKATREFSGERNEITARTLSETV
jgi:hypothetical protein